MSHFPGRCTCCGGNWNAIRLEFECVEGHIHEDVTFVCARCDQIDVNEVFDRLSEKVVSDGE